MLRYCVGVSCSAFRASPYLLSSFLHSSHLKKFCVFEMSILQGDLPIFSFFASAIAPIKYSIRLKKVIKSSFSSSCVYFKIQVLILEYLSLISVLSIKLCKTCANENAMLSKVQERSPFSAICRMSFKIPLPICPSA